MTSVFLDTVGLLAVFNKRDQWHKPAKAQFDQLFSRRISMVTSELVLLECANAASRLQFRGSIVNFRNTLLTSGRILSPTDDEYANAWDKYKTQGPGGPGVVDLISFSLMLRFEIEEAFTNDVHFRAAGFVTLF